MGGAEYPKSTEGQYRVEVGHHRPIFDALVKGALLQQENQQR